MKYKFTDPRLAALNDEDAIADDGMRAALSAALERDERAIAKYKVGAHIWVEGVLTDRALLLVKGAVRARVIRVPLPLDIVRSASSSRASVRVKTPLGKKTLWDSKIDDDAGLLSRAAQASRRSGKPAPTAVARPIRASKNEESSIQRVSPKRSVSSPSPAGSPGAPTQASEHGKPQTRRQARRAAGRRPRRPRRRRVWKKWVGFPPDATTWDLADKCVKCGRPLTDPRSRKARVGTKCIQLWGSQERKIPNPAYSAWIAKKATSEAAYIADKVRADAEFSHARLAYEESRAKWHRARSAHR